MVHRLVALAFLGPPPTPAHEVNHKNGIRSDSRVENLEWVTHLENINHSYDVLGRKRKMLGPKPRDSRMKLTEDQVREIRERIKAGETQKTIARDYPITYQHVGKIARRESWTHLDN